MQRVIVTRYGPPEVLQLEEAETPEPDNGEVLVRVARAGINFADLLARMGLYPGVPKPPFVPGYEVAGTVASVGSGVDDIVVGDRIVAGRSYGGYATHVVAPKATVSQLPDSVSFDAAAALPVNYLTAWLAVVHPGALQDGETVLIHGAAGGVGVAATQLARLRSAARIFGTASPEKHDWLREQGVEPVDRNGFRRYQSRHGWTWGRLGTGSCRRRPPAPELPQPGIGRPCRYLWYLCHGTRSQTQPTDTTARVVACTSLQPSMDDGCQPRCHWRPSRPLP